MRNNFNINSRTSLRSERYVKNIVFFFKLLMWPRIYNFVFSVNDLISYRFIKFILLLSIKWRKTSFWELNLRKMNWINLEIMGSWKFLAILWKFELNRYNCSILTQFMKKTTIISILYVPVNLKWKIEALSLWYRVPEVNITLNLWF